MWRQSWLCRISGVIVVINGGGWRLLLLPESHGVMQRNKWLLSQNNATNTASSEQQQRWWLIIHSSLFMLKSCSLFWISCTWWIAGCQNSQNHWASLEDEWTARAPQFKRGSFDWMRGVLRTSEQNFKARNLESSGRNFGSIFRPIGSKFRLLKLWEVWISRFHCA